MNASMRTRLFVCIFARFLMFPPAMLLADVIYTSSPADVTLIPGGSFVTQLQITSTNNTLGAFSTLIQYDTNVLQLSSVAAPSGSGFESNLFVNLATMRSGQARVVGFQTSTANSQARQSVLSLTWQTVGSTIKSTTITNRVESSIDASWQPNQTWALTTTGVLDQTSSNGSGLPDWWQMLFFGRLGVDPTADPDGDGLTNLQEYLAGSNPLDSANTVLITRLEVVVSGILIHFNTVLGKTYSVEKTSILAPATWSTINTNSISGTGTEQTVLDTAGLSVPQQFFYRLTVAP